MNHDPDFTNVDELTIPEAETPLELESAPSPAPAEASQPAPVIVIEYRRGLLSRLAPLALILSAALAIASFQRGRLFHYFESRPVKPPASGAPPKVEPTAEKVVARVVHRADLAAGESTRVDPATQPAPTIDAPGAVTPPPEKKAASPFDLEPVEGLTPIEPIASNLPTADPPAETSPEKALAAPPQDVPDPAMTVPPAEAPAQEPKEVTEEEIRRDIQREADQIEAERKDKDLLKPQARAKMLDESLAKIEANRAAFRNAVREAIKTMGKLGGPEIDRLCDQFGRDTPQEVLMNYHRAKRIFPRQLTRQGEVEIMRGLGFPEPVILDFLAKKVDKSKNSRGGPRTKEEVRVLAAKILLSFPLAAPSRSTPAAPPSSILGATGSP